MELLICIVDNPLSGDAELDAGRWRAGDVIWHAQDGHVWSKREVTNPNWRILRVPGLSLVEAESLASSEKPAAFGHIRLLRKRQMTVDLEQLNILEGGNVLAARTATPRGVDAVISLGQFRSHVSVKPRQNVITPQQAVHRQ